MTCLLTRLPLLVPLLLALAACASSPPPDGFLDDADAAALRAAGMGALEYAPLELRYAREKLAEARSAMDDRDFERAGRLAAQSQVNSELAVAKTIAAQAREASRAKADENQRLRDELGDEDGP